MYHFILGVHMLLTALAMAYLGVILVEKASDVTKYLLIATVCNFFVIFGYTLEIMGTDRAYSLTSVKIQFLGLIFLISFLLFFMTKICDVEIPKPMRFVIIGVDVVLLVLAMTAENHSLFFKTIDYTFDGHYPHMIVEEGVAVRFSLYYTIVQGFVFALVAIIKERRNKDRIPTPVIFLPFCFLPAIIALIFFYMLTPENMGFNPVPGSITVGMSYLIFMVYRFRLLDTTQIAKDSIVEDINEGYFVVDVSKKLLFANKLAYNILPGLREPKKRGEVIQEVFRNNRKTLDIKDKQYQVSVSPFYDRKTLKGYSLWLFDKTDELERTRRLIELKNQAEETNQAKTVFLANMSHEIRTPMNTVMGSTEMILRSNPSP